MGIVRSYSVGDELPGLSKAIKQESINQFEASGGHTGPSQFTSEETAREELGTRGTVASGRMSLTFAMELLRRYFGEDVYNRTGIADIRFLRPVRPGDTVTLSGKITAISREANGSRVTVGITIQNQNEDTVGAGTGSAVVPSGLIPPEE